MHEGHRRLAQSIPREHELRLIGDVTGDLSLRMEPYTP